MKKPADFYCSDCKKWRRVEEPTEEQIERGVAAFDEFWCHHCGGGFQCDECGYEIDRYGNCLRNEHTGESCPSTQ